MAYASAKQLLDAGHEGKWVKVSPDDARNIIESIPGENLIRGSKGHAPLRHYVDRDHIVVHSRLVDSEAHPLDTAK